MSEKKPIPRFQSEEEEQEFWDERDSTDYVNWNDARPVVLANLRPSTKTVSLRLQEHMLEELKLLANKWDVPYQSLVKVFLAERVQAELTRMRRTAPGGSKTMGGVCPLQRPPDLSWLRAHTAWPVGSRDTSETDVWQVTVGTSQRP
jgi:predicted DNA binding CopG/RHH family protein